MGTESDVCHHHAPGDGPIEQVGQLRRIGIRGLDVELRRHQVVGDLALRTGREFDDVVTLR